MTDPDLLGAVEAALAAGDSRAEALPKILALLLERFDCTTGTIHLLEDKNGMLHLAAHRGIPDVVLGKIEVIPVGKGMAGIAAERREPVQVCNLQTDSSGVVRPGARDTKMEGSVAAPMLNSQGALKGALFGVAQVAHNFDDRPVFIAAPRGACLIFSGTG